MHLKAGLSTLPLDGALAGAAPAAMPGDVMAYRCYPSAEGLALGQTDALRRSQVDAALAQEGS